MANIRGSFVLVLILGLVPGCITSKTTTEPGPPKYVSIIEVGQRNISFNVTDPDNPNGDIVGYLFRLKYRIYPNTECMERTVYLNRMASGIYVLHKHILPGVTYEIVVFTVNDGFNSTSNATLPEVTTLPDIPGVVSGPQQTYQTNTSGIIRWGRPDEPNGHMMAYRVVLNGGPTITQCRISFLCIGLCNYTILGPPNDKCTIRNDTNLAENQKNMSLLVEDLRVGTTYTLSVVGYNEVGAGASSLDVTLRTLSIVPAQVNHGSFNIRFPPGVTHFVLTWNEPAPFPGEDLTYEVTLKDALKNELLEEVNITRPAYSEVSIGLYNYYNYSIGVKPMTSAGAANIQTYSFTTPSRGDLGRPQALKINMLANDCERIVIEWFEANLEHRNGPIIGYKIENKIETEQWTYLIYSPNYWALTNRKFQYSLAVQEQASYVLAISAAGPYLNQTGQIYTSQRFQTRVCPQHEPGNIEMIVGIVFAFLVLLGICLAGIIFVYRRNFREMHISRYSKKYTKYCGGSKLARFTQMDRNGPKRTQMDPNGDPYGPKLTQMATKMDKF